MQTPKVFISYSHDNQTHKDWVRGLGEALLAQGIEVVLDQWDLHLGQDVPHFMSTAIGEVDRVLVICTERYVAKANGRVGGAGYEGMIIDGHIANDLDTTKFIPIVRQGTTKGFLPTFLSTRLYVDFRDDIDFDQRVVDLVHDIYGQSRTSKPKRGKSPFDLDPTIKPVRRVDALGEDTQQSLRWQDDVHLLRDALDFLRDTSARRSANRSGRTRKTAKPTLTGPDAGLQDLRREWFEVANSLLQGHVGKREAVAVSQAAIQMYNESFKFREFDVNNQAAHMSESDELHDRLIADIASIQDAEVRDQLRNWLEISKHNMRRRYIHLKW